MTSDVTGRRFPFPDELIGSTANKYLLLATAAFAALPGAPTPDYLIPSGFFAMNGDTLRYSPSAGYDTFTFGPGELPTDGMRCIQLTDFNTDAFVTGLNSPTNYAGQSGQVVAGGAIPTISTGGLLLTAVLLAGLGAVAASRRTRTRIRARVG
jgi:hypothetical protein